jgi:hypothetical protein
MCYLVTRPQALVQITTVHIEPDIPVCQKHGGDLASLGELGKLKPILQGILLGGSLAWTPSIFN